MKYLAISLLFSNVFGEQTLFLKDGLTLVDDNGIATTDAPEVSTDEIEPIIPKTRPGGQSEWKYLGDWGSILSEEYSTFQGYQQKVEAKSGLKYSTFEPIRFTSQVVQGMSYTIIYDVGDGQIIEVKVWVKPGEKGEIQSVGEKVKNNAKPIGDHCETQAGCGDTDFMCCGEFRMPEDSEYKDHTTYGCNNKQNPQSFVEYWMSLEVADDISQVPDPVLLEYPGSRFKCFSDNFGQPMTKEEAENVNSGKGAMTLLASTAVLLSGFTII